VNEIEESAYSAVALELGFFRTSERSMLRLPGQIVHPRPILVAEVELQERPSCLS
jgi:hypothetical protein